jgi:hypothetical protein
MSKEVSEKELVRVRQRQFYFTAFYNITAKVHATVLAMLHILPELF